MRAAYVVASAAGLLAGCAAMHTPKLDVRDAGAWRPPPAVIAEPVPATAGAIFSETAWRPLLEDRRARRPGDHVTVQIQETTQARSRSNASVDRDGKVSGSVDAAPLLGAGLLGRLKLGGASSASHDAKGETGADAEFNGTITATVIEVQPNGNLVIAGDKQVGLHGSVETLRFSGTVDPAQLRPGNVVPSNRVADARLEFRGAGDQSRPLALGWLSRFFMSVVPF